MIVYALIVTFALGTLVGCIGLFAIILHLDERDRKKAAKKAQFDKDVDKAVKLANPVGPNPFTI